MIRIDHAAVAFFVALVSAVSTSHAVAGDEGSDGKWTDLVSVIDVAEHSVQGQWNVRNGELRSAAANGSRITVPVHPTGEYDFRVEFTRHSGSDSIALMFVAGGRQAAFDVDGWGQHLSGLQLIRGQDMRAYSNQVARTTLQNNRRYTAVVEVRKNEIRALLDGKLLHSHRSSGSDLSLVPLWRMPDERSLGLGAWNANTTFHKVQIRTLEGSPTAVAANTSNVRPSTGRPAMNRETTPRNTNSGTNVRRDTKTPQPAGRTPHVLIVIANHHFFYREYAHPREELERAGIRVSVGAGRRADCYPHRGSGEGSDGGRVRPDIALASARADDYDAIVFSGGWGSSMYQYAFRGSYSDRAYNGDRSSKEAANRLINEFLTQDKYVGGICHGVSVLAWSRVDGRSALAGKRVVAPQRSGPAGIYNGQQAQPPSRWNAEQNGARLAPARSVGSPSPQDDVMVDGKIITAEDDQAARHFGVVLARLLTEAAGARNEPRPRRNNFKDRATVDNSTGRADGPAHIDTPAGTDASSAFATTIRPFLARHCIRCHGARIRKAGFRVDQHLLNNFTKHSVSEKWTEVLHMLNAGDMPPSTAPRPPPDDVARVTVWITERLREAEAASGSGRVVLRRMNRNEYNNTIRDLIGIGLRPADDFPEDPSAGGFDNIGAALSVSPLHLELYVKAARAILDRAIVTDTERPPTIRWRFEPEEGNQGLDRYRVNRDGQQIIVNAGNNKVEGGMVRIWRDGWDRGCGFRAFRVPESGEYIIRVCAAGIIPSEQQARQAGPRYHYHRQEQEEQKLSGQQLERRRAAFARYVEPYFNKHFAEDRSYRYGPPRMKIDGTLGGRIRVIQQLDVSAPPDAPQIYETRAWFDPVPAGVAIHNVYRIPQHQYNFWLQEHEDFPRPQLLVDWMELEGPVHEQWPPESHTRILIDTPNRARKDSAYARDVLNGFMRRAWRRPLREGELDSKVALFERVRAGKSSFEEAIKVPLTAVLASPAFLYLTEEVTNPSRSVSQPLDSHELAARLSYFLWSSMPDRELFRLADHGKLTEPRVLAEQVDRMLQSRKSEAFVQNFAGQWLRLREVGANPPAEKLFPRYDEHLETSMRRESEAFFGHVLHEDADVWAFLHSNFVTINERLARFYDIPGVRGDEMQVVRVPRGVPRGGLVTQASILSLTSNGTRTSPVDRGVWILETLLGDPPPPPPPNAGDIPPGVPGLDRTTVRERLRIHRENTQCARCHSKIDPLGFALENYSAAGEWREREASWNRAEPQDDDPPVDASAQLPDGTRFTGVQGLQQQLLERKDQFLRCLTEKLFVYALGRELTINDTRTIDRAVSAAQESPTLRTIIHQIVLSDAFRTKL